MEIRLHLARILLVTFLVFLAEAAYAADTKNIQIITWRGMTQAEQGFFSRLGQLGIQAKYDHFDARRSETNLAGFLRSKRTELEKKDLIYTFGTTTTKMVLNFGVGNVPVVFNIVSDPIGVGLTLSMHMPTYGATGAKQSLSVEVILQLLEQVYPYESIAVLFDPREPNSTNEASRVTKVASVLQKEVIQVRFVPDAHDAEFRAETVRSQIKAADVVYVTSTSSFVSNNALMRQLLTDDVVSVSSSPVLVDHGVSLSFGETYWQRGEAAANLAAEILLEKKVSNEIPINEIKANESILFIKKASPIRSKLDLSAFPDRVKYR
ncbi:ABC transporter substrate binding protein [Roseibium sp.]|uniref:ABC transporter substrate binding protein n=1 Tax=Roseibium sp. TaxID=1936156 RepID=UPI003D0AE3C3